MDGGGYYVGPSFQAGTDYDFTLPYTLSLYLHYFPGSLDDTYNGISEKGKYRSAIIALLIQKYLSGGYTKGWFLGGGLAVQKTKEDYVSDLDEIHDKKIIVVGAMRVGRIIHIMNKMFTIELNATGPHTGKVGPAPYFEQKKELLTQLSVGVRMILK